ncbi:hypothetical protein QN400_21265 [Pseudomonas sp. RTC3]|uniref:hypothetical protein n=1 Tax=Pseudomonas sp. 5C2 TaxID=3048588 RepID=UPI002AB4A1E9|nr:hypothetical protein [Pseudomonas sp. 5C2]MDY7567485.1 hypothetical protein [Pseudomonas sp. 5C2]MEB0064547.1 hypothetical protein [Pseudomonas sp. RTC3]MEB0243045.1 hypothetical protein [Pseudomonas sp. 5C2]
MGNVSKHTVRIENYVHKGAGTDRFSLAKRVRCTTADGETIYFKELVVPGYLHSAMTNKKMNTLYVVDINNGKAHCLVAYENGDVAKFDPDEIDDVAKGFRNSGLFFFFGGTLASVLALIAYGLGLIMFPIAMYMAWKYFVKIPSMLKRDDVIAGLKTAGFRFSGSEPPVSATPAQKRAEWPVDV